MTKRRDIQVSALSRITGAITNRFPNLNDEEADDVKDKILQYVAAGLENGYDIALIRTESEDEMKLKVLKLREEDDEEE